MAEVTSGPGLGAQVVLVADLRWRLFRNGLRGLTAKLSLFGSIFVGIVWTVLGIGAAIAIGVGSYFLVAQGFTKYLSAILWGIFLFWQAFPILSAQLASTFDSTNLLRFPLKFSAFMVLNLAYGFADPASLCGIVWHFAMWIGITAARPDLWFRAGLILLLSAAMNLVFSRMLYAWLERILAQRRTREVLFALFILVMLCFQFSGMIVTRYSKPVTAFVAKTSYVWAALPPGQVGVSLQSFLVGAASPALIAGAVVILYAAVFAALFAFRLHAVYLGELFSESAAPARIEKKSAVPRSVQVAAPVVASPDSAQRSFIPGTVEAVFLKEVRYLYRNTMSALNLFLPLIIVGAMSLNSRAVAVDRPGRHGGGGMVKFFASNFAYPGAVAYALLILMQFSMNSLAYDGGGVQMFYLVPVKFRTIMLGKNIFQGALLALEALMCWALITAISGPPPVIVVLCTWTGLAFVALINIAAGNYLSLRFPRKFEFGVRARRASGASSLLAFLVYFACLGLLGGVAALVRFLAGAWFIPVAFAVLAVAALAVYLQVLNETSNQAVRQREALIDQLVR